MTSVAVVSAGRPPAVMTDNANQRPFRLRHRETVPAGIRGIARGQLRRRGRPPRGAQRRGHRRGGARGAQELQAAAGHRAPRARRARRPRVPARERRLPRRRSPPRGPARQQVLLETLDGLCERFPDDLEAAGLGALSRPSRGRAGRRRAPTRAASAARAEVVEDCRAAAGEWRAGRWRRTASRGWHRACSGSTAAADARCERRRRRRRTSTSTSGASASRTSGTRPRSCSPRRPPAWGSSPIALTTVADVLGADHDLAILRDRAAAHRAEFADSGDLRRADGLDRRPPRAAATKGPGRRRAPLFPQAARLRAPYGASLAQARRLIGTTTRVLVTRARQRRAPRPRHDGSRQRPAPAARPRSSHAPEP